MALFGLIFLFVMLVLFGVGIAAGLVACVVAAVLVGVGVLSSSVVVGLLARRTSTGVRAFLLQCALLPGIPSGILCAWDRSLAFHSFSQRLAYLSLPCPGSARSEKSLTFPGNYSLRFF